MKRHQPSYSMDQMELQIEELGAKIRASDQFIRTELSQMHTKYQHSKIIQIDQFKQAMETNQTKILRTFTDNILQDSLKVEEKVLQVEKKVHDLEKIIQQEQHASLLALEAISEAMESSGSS
jgi:TRAP-type mannitol/chloroaromatic compound transport system substrate-binding protein